MHEYLMECERFFGKRLRFQVTANDPADALHVAESSDILRMFRITENVIEGSLRCIRRLKPSDGREG